ncbi:MAG: low molecular weight phosphotyrosine protein phosphatase [Lachnospiraceae bacterium]|jgi:protein-tyrosine phosphatase|nr:low molecular weight phosphotyrosine protein phosphatase [Lachnospiraceae bacterium]
MTKILFVCTGNICRSPMAEFIMKNMVKEAGFAEEFYIASAATTTEELGNPVYPGARKRLAEEGISVAGKYAVQIKRGDYEKYDYLIGMESRHIAHMLRVFGGDPEGKVSRLLEFAGSSRDIADPWYSGNFDTAYDDIYEGCEALLRELQGGIV